MVEYCRLREAGSSRGYCFAKYDGESIFTIIGKALQTEGFSRFDARRADVVFTFDS